MKTYIIAEVGANHNGCFKRAKKYIDELSKIKVDAVKFQLSNPDDTFSSDAIIATYEKNSKGYNSKKNLIDNVKKRQLSKKQHKKLFEYCRSKKIDYLCSAFDLDSLKFLIDELKIKKIKIPSGEIHSLDTLNYLNNSKRDFEIILSTGMATFEDISFSLKYLKNKKKIKILHCVSNYPAEYNDLNLLSINQLKNYFNYEIGFSDHSLGNLASCIAVGMGATIIEKHVTLRKSLSGPDHEFSLNIREFEDLVLNIRNIEKMLGNKNKPISKKEILISKVARKSIVAKKNLKAHDIIRPEDICYKRPGFGLSPLLTKYVINKRVKKNIKINKLILKRDLI